MSEFCLSPKNVPLSYWTVMDFGRVGTALGRDIKGVRVKSEVLGSSFCLVIFDEDVSCIRLCVVFL